MKRHRWQLLTLVALLLALVAAGCGGDDGDGGEGAATTEEAAQEVSGSVTVLAVWTGAEGEAFQAVLDGFTEQNPNVNVTYRSAKDPGQVLATSVEGGNPPDLAALPSPGLMRDFASRGALKPIDFARDAIAENYAESWLDLGTVDGTLYGLFFKGANKSTVWYNVAAFEDAGVEPPEDWETFLSNAETLKSSGVPAYSIGGADGWTLTDLFENIYLRTAGPEKYDQLSRHEIPWTDPSVTEALSEMAKIFSASDNLAGGTTGALQTDFPTSVSNVFAPNPKAAMVIEADFVPGVVETTLEAETGYNFFTFPSINDSPASVVAKGNLVIAFRDTPAVRAFMEYLVSPESAEIWVKRGGFATPNKNVDPASYPDPLLRETSETLSGAETLRFDLGDLQPSAFGATVGQGMWKLFQDLLKTPSDVDGIARQLEADAAKAFK